MGDRKEKEKQKKEMQKQQKQQKQQEQIEQQKQQEQIEQQRTQEKFQKKIHPGNIKRILAVKDNTVKYPFLCCFTKADVTIEG